MRLTKLVIATNNAPLLQMGQTIAHTSCGMVETKSGSSQVRAPENFPNPSVVFWFMPLLPRLYQSMGAVPWAVSHAFALLKCLQPKKPR